MPAFKSRIRKRGTHIKNPFRNVILHWRRFRNEQAVEIDGIIVSTRPEIVPRSVRTALFKKTYEAPERHLVASAINKTDRVLEIGSGIGLVSLVAAKICGPENVLSYEANPNLKAVIEENHRLNRMTLNLRMKAVTVDGADASFFVDENIISSSLIDRASAREITVSSESLNDILDEFRPTALILDVEGAEVELLSHVNLGSVKKIIVELHPHIVGDDAIESLEGHIEKKGFKLIDRQKKTSLYEIDSLFYA